MSRLPLTFARVGAPPAAPTVQTRPRAGLGRIARRLLALALAGLGALLAARASFGSGSTTSPAHTPTVAPVTAVPMPAAIANVHAAAVEPQDRESFVAATAQASQGALISVGQAVADGVYPLPHMWFVYRIGVR